MAEKQCVIQECPKYNKVASVCYSEGSLLIGEVNPENVCTITGSSGTADLFQLAGPSPSLPCCINEVDHNTGREGVCLESGKCPILRKQSTTDPQLGAVRYKRFTPRNVGKDHYILDSVCPPNTYCPEAYILIN